MKKVFAVALCLLLVSVGASSLDFRYNGKAGPGIEEAVIGELPLTVEIGGAEGNLECELFYLDLKSLEFAALKQNELTEFGILKGTEQRPSFSFTSSSGLASLKSRLSEGGLRQLFVGCRTSGEKENSLEEAVFGFSESPSRGVLLSRDGGKNDFVLALDDYELVPTLYLPESKCRPEKAGELQVEICIEDAAPESAKVLIGEKKATLEKGSIRVEEISGNYLLLAYRGIDYGKIVRLDASSYEKLDLSLSGEALGQGASTEAGTGSIGETGLQMEEKKAKKFLEEDKAKGGHLPFGQLACARRNGETLKSYSAFVKDGTIYYTNPRCSELGSDVNTYLSLDPLASGTKCKFVYGGQVLDPYEYGDRNASINLETDLPEIYGALSSGTEIDFTIECSNYDAKIVTPSAIDTVEVWVDDQKKEEFGLSGVIFKQPRFAFSGDKDKTFYFVFPAPKEFIDQIHGKIVMVQVFSKKGGALLYSFSSDDSRDNSCTSSYCYVPFYKDFVYDSTSRNPKGENWRRFVGMAEQCGFGSTCYARIISSSYGGIVAESSGFSISLT